ncbi:hypothetical protein BC833DRAFT_564012 [Globomyces pollinis-pini]|nr:hypothetical protein BC833DRAFT_564012 [Globomyces pollinis-pini]
MEFTFPTDIPEAQYIEFLKTAAQVLSGNDPNSNLNKNVSDPEPAPTSDRNPDGNSLETKLDNVESKIMSKHLISIPDSKSKESTDTKTNKKPIVNRACVNCKASHVACDVVRPCQRCIRLGKIDSCVDAVLKKRGRPLNPNGPKKSSTPRKKKPKMATPLLSSAGLRPIRPYHGPNESSSRPFQFPHFDNSTKLFSNTSLFPQQSYHLTALKLLQSNPNLQPLQASVETVIKNAAAAVQSIGVHDLLNTQLQNLNKLNAEAAGVEEAVAKHDVCDIEPTVVPIPTVPIPELQSVELPPEVNPEEPATDIPPSQIIQKFLMDLQSQVTPSVSEDGKTNEATSSEDLMAAIHALSLLMPLNENGGLVFCMFIFRE